MVRATSFKMMQGWLLKSQREVETIKAVCVLFCINNVFIWTEELVVINEIPELMIGNIFIAGIINTGQLWMKNQL